MSPLYYKQLHLSVFLSYILFLIAVSLCTGRRSNEEYCFILLLTGLHLGRCPSEAVCSKMELTSLVSAFFHP